jgi:hypothetical protein
MQVIEGNPTGDIEALRDYDKKLMVGVVHKHILH